MVMSNDEIVTEYRQAKAPQKQIGILADLNRCSKQEIVAVLAAAGVELPKTYSKAKAPKTETSAMEAPGWETVTPAAAPSEKRSSPLTLERLINLFPEAFVASQDVPVLANGKGIRTIRLSGVYDVATDQTEWGIDLIPESDS